MLYGGAVPLLVAQLETVPIFAPRFEVVEAMLLTMPRADFRACVAAFTQAGVGRLVPFLTRKSTADINACVASAIDNLLGDEHAHAAILDAGVVVALLAIIKARGWLEDDPVPALIESATSALMTLTSLSHTKLNGEPIVPSDQASQNALGRPSAFHVGNIVRAREQVRAMGGAELLVRFVRVRNTECDFTACAVLGNLAADGARATPATAFRSVSHACPVGCWRGGCCDWQRQVVEWSSKRVQSNCSSMDSRMGLQGS